MPRTANYERFGGQDREISYQAYKTMYEFHKSEAFVRQAIGPMGSGKSTAMVQEIFRRCREQAPWKSDGIRRSRWACIRNTYPDLLSTTLKTFLYWFPEGTFGSLRQSIPIVYTLRYEDVEAEILFLAIEGNKDIRKLLSLDLTGAWLNENREMPKTVLDFVEGRVGRYPPAVEGGPTYKGVIMDTNPPDDDHWIAKLDNKIQHYKATGEILVEEGDEGDDGAAGIFGTGAMDDMPETKFDPTQYEVFKQPSGLSANAENIENLPDGYKYYHRLASNKTADFVRVNVHGLYGKAQDAKPVYPTFRRNLVDGSNSIPWNVSRERLLPNPKLPLLLGWDFGLTPACVLAQITPRGQLAVLEELHDLDMGVRRFVETKVLAKLNTTYRGYQIVSTGDPSGEYRSDTDESTCMEILKGLGIPTRPAHSNSPVARIGAVLKYLDRSVDGRAGLIVSPNCSILIRGFEGGYRFRRVKSLGDGIFTDEIEKKGNMYTHVHDALQYLCLRMAKITTSNRRAPPPRRYRPADSVAGY